MNKNKIFLLIFITASLFSCAEYSVNKTKDKKEKIYFSSSGFALIYDEKYFLEKVVNIKIKSNEDIVVMHSLLKSNTPIKIVNPINSKVVETKIYRKANYPKIFSAVISKQIASYLELDENNPFIEIYEIKKNKTFIAKESNTFDEERNVSEKAPVDEVKMDVLTEQKIKKEETSTLIDYNYIIVINDFYYLDSANNLRNTLIKNISKDKISVKKVGDNKYRLYAGPFKNFSTLKTTYISLNNLGFENLNIYNE